jgi:hypothetical protein
MKQEKLLIFILFILIMSSFVIAQDTEDTKLEPTFDANHPETFDWANGDYSTIPWENSNIYKEIDWDKVKFDQIKDFDNINFNDPNLDLSKIPNDHWHTMPSDAYDKMMEDLGAKGTYNFKNKGDRHVMVTKDGKVLLVSEDGNSQYASFNFKSVKKDSMSILNEFEEIDYAD